MPSDCETLFSSLAFFVCFPSIDQGARCELTASVGSVFHASLVIFAAIQIHETKTALVRQPNCDSTVDYVVCSTLCYPYGLANSHVFLSSHAVALAPYTER